MAVPTAPVNLNLVQFNPAFDVLKIVVVSPVVELNVFENIKPVFALRNCTLQRLSVGAIPVIAAGSESQLTPPFEVRSTVEFEPTTQPVFASTILILLSTEVAAVVQLTIFQFVPPFVDLMIWSNTAPAEEDAPTAITLPLIDCAHTSYNVLANNRVVKQILLAAVFLLLINPNAPTVNNVSLVPI